MAMDKFLAEYYGTLDTTKTAAAAAEDLEKQASVDVFLKLAAAENIDLTKMPEADVQKLYDNWVKAASAPTPAAPAAGATKTAEEEKKEHEEKKKLEEAKKEHEEKKAQSEKVAEADFLGRVMAHAYVQELRNIEKAASAPAAAPAAGAPRVKTAEEEKKEKEEKEKKEHEGKHEPPKGGEDGKHHMPPAFMEHLKHGSALDKVAAERAYSLAAAANLDPVEAFNKVAGVINLGLAKETSEKVASAPFEQAIGIRALELLEKAGYPVAWDQK